MRNNNAVGPQCGCPQLDKIGINIVVSSTPRTRDDHINARDNNILLQRFT